MNVDFCDLCNQDLTLKHGWRTGCDYPRIKIRAQNHEHGAVHSNYDLATDPDRVIGADAGLEFFFLSYFFFLKNYLFGFWLC